MRRLRHEKVMWLVLMILKRLEERLGGRAWDAG
jgi:hypothetical protein